MDGVVSCYPMPSPSIRKFTMELGLVETGICMTNKKELVVACVIKQLPAIQNHGFISYCPDVGDV